MCFINVWFLQILLELKKKSHLHTFISFADVSNLHAIILQGNHIYRFLSLEWNEVQGHFWQIWMETIFTVKKKTQLKMLKK